MAELQSCCKQAGIGLPFSQVLAGKGLYDDMGRDSGGSSAAGSSAYGDGVSGSGGAGEGGRGSSADGTRRRPIPAPAQRPVGHGAGDDGTESSPHQQRPGGSAVDASTLPLAGKQEGGEEPSWRQALVEEMFRVVVICVCALVFSLLLKFFKGDDPLGRGSGFGLDSAGPEDEL